MATLVKIFPKNAKTQQRLVIFATAKQGIVTSTYANVNDEFTLVEGEQFDLSGFTVELITGSDGVERKWIVG